MLTLLISNSAAFLLAAVAIYLARNVDERKLTVKFKKLYDDAKEPVRANSEDAAWDVFCHSIQVGKEGFVACKIGIAVEAPKGFSFIAVPRSSLSKKGWALSNSIGIIDNPYRGEIEYRFRPTLSYVKQGFHNSSYDMLPGQEIPFEVGERIGQIKLVRDYDLKFVEVSELSDSSRGAKGFGSSGKS